MSPLQDPITVDTGSRKQEFHHSKVSYMSKCCATLVSRFSVNRSREGRRLREGESIGRSSGWKKCKAEILCCVDVRQVSLLILQVPRGNAANSPRPWGEDNFSGEHGCGPTGGADRHSWFWSGGGGGCGWTPAMDQRTQLWRVRNTFFNFKSFQCLTKLWHYYTVCAFSVIKNFHMVSTPAIWIGCRRQSAVKCLSGT